MGTDPRGAEGHVEDLAVVLRATGVVGVRAPGGAALGGLALEDRNPRTGRKRLLAEPIEQVVPADLLADLVGGQLRVGDAGDQGQSEQTTHDSEAVTTYGAGMRHGGGSRSVRSLIARGSAGPRSALYPPEITLLKSRCEIRD